MIRLYALIALVLMATPAFASIPTPLPEPGSMTLVAAGLAGAAIAVRLRRRR